MTLPLPGDLVGEINEYKDLALPLLLAHTNGKKLPIDGNSWRNKVESVRDGQFMFVGPNSGKEFCTANFSSFVKLMLKRHTGKAMNAHMMRDVVITDLMDRGVSGAVRSSYAAAMGQSLQTQEMVYDRQGIELTLFFIPCQHQHIDIFDGLPMFLGPKLQCSHVH